MSVIIPKLETLVSDNIDITANYEGGSLFLAVTVPLASLRNFSNLRRIEALRNFHKRSRYFLIALSILLLIYDVLEQERMSDNKRKFEACLVFGKD